MQALVRNLKTKDQHIQESGVKIELMERRMETVKKQGEMIQDLESEIQKARKQERAYEEAMEQLQSDLDALEQENKKLKAVATSAERQGERSYRRRGVTTLSIGIFQLRQAHSRQNTKPYRWKETWKHPIFWNRSGHLRCVSSNY